MTCTTTLAWANNIASVSGRALLRTGEGLSTKDLSEELGWILCYAVTSSVDARSNAFILVSKGETKHSGAYVDIGLAALHNLISM